MPVNVAAATGETATLTLQVRDFPGATGGLSTVATDASITGDGSSGSPLSVATPVPSDTEIGDKAFSNPPTDLSDAEKEAVRDNIGITGTGADGQDGAPGEDGQDGAPGEDGEDGADGEGVPTGGTAGQLLEKIDGTDYNTRWATKSIPANFSDLTGEVPVAAIPQAITRDTELDARITGTQVQRIPPVPPNSGRRVWSSVDGSTGWREEEGGGEASTGTLLELLGNGRVSVGYRSMG